MRTAAPFHAVRQGTGNSPRGIEPERSSQKSPAFVPTQTRCSRRKLECGREAVSVLRLAVDIIRTEEARSRRWRSITSFRAGVCVRRQPPHRWQSVGSAARSGPSARPVTSGSRTFAHAISGLNTGIAAAGEVEHSSGRRKLDLAAGARSGRFARRGVCEEAATSVVGRASAQ